MKQYFLSSTAAFAPPDTPTEPDDDRIPEPTLDDDETPTDPVDPEVDPEDDPDADPDDDPDADPEPEPGTQQTRGERRQQKLANIARERAEENAKLTRELAEMRGRLDAIQRQPAAPAETAQQRAERFALMSPEERAMEMVNESLQRHERNQQALTNQLLDQSDRTAFESHAASTPLLKKMAPEIERVRQTIMQRDGGNLSRMDVAKYLIGQRVLEQQGKGKPAAQQRRRQQQARPASGRGDVPSPRRERGRTGDPVADFENKYGDVSI